MTWHETTDVEQFLAAAGNLLLGDPGRHTVGLTVTENVRARPDGTRFAWWTDEAGEVTGAASQTPPYPLLLSVVPDEAARNPHAPRYPGGAPGRGVRGRGAAGQVVRRVHRRDGRPPPGHRGRGA